MDHGASADAHVDASMKNTRWDHAARLYQTMAGPVTESA